VFAFSAALAGLGGGLLAIQEGRANYSNDFTPFFGLFWVVLVVSIGARTVEGAIQAGFGLKVFPELVLVRILHASPTWEFIFFGLGAIAYAKNPEGTLEAGKRRSLNGIQRLLDARTARKTALQQAIGAIDVAKPSGDGVGSDAKVKA
jgi:ABC-type branched-subunit amino acid transport system permease subunit